MVLTVIMMMMAIQPLWAEEVTPEEALRQAQSFMKKRVAVGGKSRSAQSVKMTATPQVYGLYVFNVAHDGGYVIISNDDRTLPVLGYSDSGHLNPDDMPENMKAWLQGYADEIAWINEHQITTTATPAKIGTHATDNIDPLITTQWSQGVPYNDQCPRYPKDNDKAPHCITGCVATAMAQVMNYHKWPDQPTTPIPGYSLKNNPNVDTSVDLPVEIPLTTTFDWAHMKDTYTGSEPVDDPTAKAVSSLMKYCGWSVKMQYGLSFSGAYDTDIAPALKTYFGYKNTTQLFIRNMYSYANWTDMIYNELKQKRPVIYCGQGEAGGHCFVCDGYKYENEQDLFHINWGWGGELDGFYVLSVLNADESKGWVFNYNQSAVVGIQKPSEEGTVLSFTPNTINLTVNSISLSSTSTVVGTGVDVTINVTNNSEDAYDGDLVLCVNNYVDKGEVFEIPAETTKDCTIQYIPRSVGTYKITARIPDGKGWYNAADDDKSVTLNANTLNLTLLNDDSAQPKGHKNADVINANNRNTATVTLSGRTLYKDGHWNTLVLPFSMTAEQVTAQLAPTAMMTLKSSSFENGTLTLEFGDVTKIVAGTPYIIRWDKAEGYVDDDAHNLVNPVFTDVTIDKNLSNVRTSTYANFIGIASPKAFEANDFTKLFLGAQNKLYYPNASMNLGAFRAYFELIGITASDLANARINFIDEQIDEAELEDREISGIVSMNNEQCTINNEWYTLDGRKLDKQPTKKGLYIRNGRKVKL